MIKYLFKKKVEKEVAEHGKKIAIYTAVAMTGVGAYLIYKSAKKSRHDYENEFMEYLNHNEYVDNGYGVEEDVEGKNDLEKKVDEFNSRRITYENSPQVCLDEMEHYVDTVEDGKKEVNIDKEDYKEEEYENYEYYDGHVINKK
ncbi:MAG: hypothetical protein RSD22_09180 [Romboutsia sp.]